MSWRAKTARARQFCSGGELACALDMRRTASTRSMRLAAAAAAVAALAAVPGSEAFAAPVSSHGLRLATTSGAFCKAGQPLSYIKRARTSAAAGDMRMELLGKRYWLWNVSEWALDKFIALTQVVVFTLYGLVQRLFESPYDEDRLKAIRRRIAELRASREEQAPTNAVDMMDVVWEVGAADEKVATPTSLQSESAVSQRIGSAGRPGPDEDGNIEAPTMDSRQAFGFTLVSLPLFLQFLSAVQDDVYLRACANASIWFVFLVVFVDWAAGSPGGVATQVKRIMPVEARKAINAVTPRSVYFTEEADRGRRGGGEGQLPRPPHTWRNGLW